MAISDDQLTLIRMTSMNSMHLLIIPMHPWILYRFLTLYIPLAHQHTAHSTLTTSMSFSTVRAPLSRALRTPASRSTNQVMSKRFQQLDNHGGKPKLVRDFYDTLFRHALTPDIPLRPQRCALLSTPPLTPDLPVELYPVGFVVGVAVIGGAFGRSFPPRPQYKCSSQLSVAVVSPE